MKIIPILSTAVLLSAVVAPVASRAGDIFDQNRRLGRGVNIIGYDPLWRSRDQARFHDQHFRLLKEAGFNSVRINLHPFRRIEAANGYKLPESWFAIVDWALKNTRDQGLNAILDLHEFTVMGEDPEGNKEKFLAFWRQVSERYKDSPDNVFFEVLNEPNKKLTPALWNDYFGEALGIIRRTNPQRAVIVGPAFWNNIAHLHELELPAGDTNLIVTVHYYTPMEFTHQGAAWANQPKTGVEWTGSESERAAIDKDFDKAAGWAREHNRPLFLGEFGAYDKGPTDSRARYTAAVARAAEKRGWAWAYWQFDSDFILYDINKDAWVLPIRQALIPN